MLVVWLPNYARSAAPHSSPVKALSAHLAVLAGWALRWAMYTLLGPCTVASLSQPTLLWAKRAYARPDGPYYCTFTALSLPIFACEGLDFMRGWTTNVPLIRKKDRDVPAAKSCHV